MVSMLEMHWLLAPGSRQSWADQTTSLEGLMQNIRFSSTFGDVQTLCNFVTLDLRTKCVALSSRLGTLRTKGRLMLFSPQAVPPVKGVQVRLFSSTEGQTESAPVD